MDPIKDHFDSQEPHEAPGTCPQAADLAELATGTPSPKLREELVEHLISCSVCTEKLATLKKYAAAPPAERVPSEALNRKVLGMLGTAPEAKSLRVPAWVWPAGFALFMGLSFAVPRHFIQMLVISVVFAGKWLIESRARILRVDVTHRSPGTEQGRIGGRLGSGSEQKEPHSGRD